MTWDLPPGTDIGRDTVHGRYGGRPSSRISPSAKTPNILLFTTVNDIDSAHDGFTGEHVHFGGEGNRDGSDQHATAQGNKAIRDHAETGRTLRLFSLHSGRYGTYVGAFRLDPDTPTAWAEGDHDPKRGAQPGWRLVFRLLPVDGPPHGLKLVTASSPELRVEPTAPLRERHRWYEPTLTGLTARMLRRYATHLEDAGHELTGYRVLLPGLVTALPVDLFDRTRGELVVARPSMHRGAIWDAIGELHDLARFFQDARRLIVLPREPDPDTADLCARQQIAVTWPDADGYRRA
ncbi:MAG: hypothetical protein HOV68_05435 [Streptomycetaceae bacterium]|nr:hypothetical protein [Streptomycetaceae bacterium]